MVTSESHEPEIQWNHIDGPLLRCSDGHIHWLTLWERVQFHLGLTDLEKLNNKHNR